MKKNRISVLVLSVAFAATLALVIVGAAGVVGAMNEQQLQQLEDAQ
ncbi:hypothetical protein SAMN06295974_3732 [Plantibacter flavus]|uniref:Uncharacterized protein n=1 Tax=Plantibacter flavus TaxID=150123 RepID=A0A3N2BLI3_9MICO|nr:hypothetical protein [Plantibacter flavus]ROR76120.1 hypothetical protein EDD42_4073 [Plantibacter flavus]SMG48424.1 hypothetical protein SAMN06295974_3732 [Plantibacter flavus]